MNTFSSICMTFFCLMACLSLRAQEGIQLNTADAYQKYLFYHSNGSNYLVDNCGKKVHDYYYQSSPLYHPKLTHNGDAIYLGTNSITRVSWNGNKDIIYQNSDNDFQFNYEVIEMNNGNYLCIGRRIFTPELKDVLGYNLMSSIYDVVVEVDPIQNKIVWEWRSIDHTIQDKDNSKSNHGVVSDHPELLDFNSLSNYDWGREAFMINGMDYNEELDQIVVSLRKMSEIAIIDHSTTTAEAAAHSGGNHGKGGDLLYRWGNPENYGHGNSEDREFGHQHNPNWIKYGPYKDMIITFNNRLESDQLPFDDYYSSVDIIQPPVDSLNNYFLNSTGKFGPEQVSWRYVDTMSTSFPMFSGYTSAARVLPNSNVLISVGGAREVIEVTIDKEKVWNYFLPRGTFMFRTEAYGSDFSGFENRELVPSEAVELPPSDYDCMLFSNTDEIVNVDHQLKIRLFDDYIEFSSDIASNINIRVYDMKGIEKFSLTETGLTARVNSSKLSVGMYVATLTTDRAIISKKFYIAQ